MAARPLRFSPGEDNHQEALTMQQNKLDFGVFIGMQRQLRHVPACYRSGTDSAGNRDP